MSGSGRKCKVSVSKRSDWPFKTRDHKRRAMNTGKLSLALTSAALEADEKEAFRLSAETKLELHVK